MNNNNFLRTLFSILLPAGLLLFVFSKWNSSSDGCVPSNDAAKATKSNQAGEPVRCDTKQKGAHVFGLIDSTNYQDLTSKNLEWVTLVAWASQKDHTSSHLGHHNGDSLYIRESNADWLWRIKLAKSLGFKVFIKPHIWVNAPSTGKWRSDIFPTDEKNWELWKESYRDFIFRYANIAEQSKADMFCLGTELTRLAVEKPEFWENLIREVRGIYSGKITYAANWYEEYEKITFWGELDFVGIQAYFPLVKNEHPSVKQISKGWNKYLRIMDAIYKKYDRKILFTEMGYKSTADSAIEPWQWLENFPNHRFTYSTETQANCYQAFFNTVWNKEWFAGVHIWQLRSNYKKGNEINDLDFTPQGKPAESVIASGFE